MLWSDMYDDLRAFVRENKDYCISFAVVIVVCVSGLWYCVGKFRNEPIYQRTNQSVEHVEAGVNSITERIDTMQDRAAEIQKAAGAAVGAVDGSREAAYEIERAVSGTEERIDAAIQRCGRIENIIADIEAANRK